MTNTVNYDEMERWLTTKALEADEQSHQMLSLGYTHLSTELQGRASAYRKTLDHLHGHDIEETTE